MAQETVKAIDAGMKEVNVNVVADGTFVAFSFPGGSFKIIQKTLEHLLVVQHDEANKAKVAARVETKMDFKKEK